MTLAVGNQIAGRYRIDRILEIGSSTIALASHLGANVVLKIVEGDDPAAVKSLVAIARSLTQLHSDHACRISDLGTEPGLAYLVLEHCDGLDLARLLVRDGRLALVEAIEYIVQAIEPLAEAHALGLAHGKLAASKLVVTKRHGRPFIKVLGVGGSTQPEPRAADFRALANILDDAAAKQRPTGFADVLGLCRNGELATLTQFADALAPFAAS